MRDRDRVIDSLVTREELRVEPLLLCIERSDEVALDACLGRCSRHVPPGGGPGEDPGHSLERLCLSAGLGTPRVPPGEELKEVSGVREVWASLLRLLPPRDNPVLDKWRKMDGWIFSTYYV
ncbi:hypothetical protein L3Q82_019951, partial [Scortum barcoo]